MNHMTMTSAEILTAIENGANLTHFEYVKARIRECNDVRLLRTMLLDTLENAKNSNELAEDLTDFYLD